MSSAYIDHDSAGKGTLQQCRSRISGLDTCESPGEAASPEATSRKEKWTKRTTHKPSQFGTFRLLPAEIRLKIWQHLMPELRDECEAPRELLRSQTKSTPRSGERLAILCTSRVLKKEVGTELYRSRILHITVRPDRRGWRAEGLPGFSMMDFKHTIFSMFASIKIEIFSSKIDDPGELLYARAAVYNLVCVLRGFREAIEHCDPYSKRDDQSELTLWMNRNEPESPEQWTCPRIPPLQICFANSGTDAWHNHRSDPHHTFKETFQYSDLELMIAPFAYLRNVTRISFEFPSGLTLPTQLPLSWMERILPKFRLVKLIEFVRRQVSNRRLYKYEWPSRELDFLEHEAERYLALDAALDHAPGPTAAILRRERLIHWRWYRRVMEGHFLLDPHDVPRYGPLQTERYRDFWKLDQFYENHGWKLHNAQDTKWLEEWRSLWPNGIPPKGSNEWYAVIDAAARRG